VTDRSAERPRPTRGDYVAWRTITTRWRDDDAYGHLNNATYYELFDTAVNAHLYDETGLDIRALPAIGIVAETSCRYYRALGFPDPIDAGLMAERVGGSSVVYRIGLFQGDSDEAAAEGRFVHVYVDNTDPERPVVPLPAEIRAAVEQLVPG
jgi:acyl-CoA thioester hydrolase